MLSIPLLKRETRGNAKSFLIFGGVLAMYYAVIVMMFDPEMGAALAELAASMPELMAVFGMANAASTLVGFIASYMYGFLMPVMPMVFAIMCANKLVARHVDRGSMAWLLAAPAKRSAVVVTQSLCLILCVSALVAFCAVFGAVCCEIYFPGALDMARYAQVNFGVLCLQLFISGVCFLCSCAFGEAGRSVMFGAGIPTLAFIVQMAANFGPELEKLKYFTFFSLYNPDAIAAGQAGALTGSFVLLAGALALFAAAYTVFCKKDLYI